MVNMVIFAGENIRKYGVKTFHVGAIFMIRLVFPYLSHMRFIR